MTSMHYCNTHLATYPARGGLRTVQAGRCLLKASVYILVVAVVVIVVTVYSIVAYSSATYKHKQKLSTSS